MLKGPGPALNVLNGFVVLPPRMARLQAVAAAASGATLDALRQAAPAAAANAAVQAELMRGVTRSLSAAPNAVFMPAFLAAASLAARPALSLLSAADLAADPQLRLTVTDAVDVTIGWPQVAAIQGVWTRSGQRYSVPLLRITGPTLTHAGAGYGSTGLAAGDGRWLIRITPSDADHGLDPTALSAALADVTAAIATQPAGAARTGDLLLPVQTFARGPGNPDLTALLPAADPVNADLRRLDGGGTHVEAAAGSASLQIAADGLHVVGGETAAFVFDPRNLYAGGYAGESTLVNIGGDCYAASNGPPCYPPCPAGPPEVPAYLALVESSGRVTLLAQWTSLAGSRCE